MRSLLLIAGVIVLVAGVMLFGRNEPRETPGVQSDTETNETEVSSEMSDHSDMEMDDMDMSEPEGDVQGGNDVGMEFPDMDMTIPEDAKVFDVSGTNFAYNIKEIRVNEGDTVTINFTSESGLHDWVVDEFDAATSRVQSGGQSSVTFVADQKGTFEYYCSVGSHRANGMVGTLIVE